MAQRLPSLNWLRVFEAAARCESFSRAALQLNMSAAAVSQQIKALEQQLNADLFVRHAHAVSLTAAGRAYLPVVQQSLLTLQSATAGLFGDVGAQPLYVQSVLIYAHGILAGRLNEFRQLHPAINLLLSTGNAVSDFTQRFSDLQIVFGNPQQFGRSSDVLMGEWLYPVATAKVAETIFQPADLLRYPLIEVATHRAGWPSVLDALGMASADADVLFADSSIMGAALAGSGAGIALARAPASDRVMREAALTPCLTDFRLRGAEAYHLVYEDAATLRPAARAFRAWLLDYAESDRSNFVDK